MCKTAACSVALIAMAMSLASSAEAKPVESSFGAKLLVGGNMWTTPSQAPSEDLGFMGNGGGWGYGIGVAYELRVVTFLGFELGGFYDHSGLYRDVTRNGVEKFRESIGADNFRIPLLVKGILPVPLGRLWLGLGPEFIVPLSVSTNLELQSAPGALKQSDKDRLQAEKSSSTMLTGALGLVVELPPSLELPFDLRIARNLSQKDAWGDRVSLQGSSFDTAALSVKAQNSWDLRLTAGIGYRF